MLTCLLNPQILVQNAYFGRCDDYPKSPPKSPQKAHKSPSNATFYRLFMNIIPQGAIQSYISLLFDMKQRYVLDYCTEDR